VDLSADYYAATQYARASCRLWSHSIVLERLAVADTAEPLNEIQIRGNAKCKFDTP
jgi:hypothetical protein